MKSLKKNYFQNISQRDEYIAAINRAIDYIEKNIEGKLQLHSIARAAGFSPFHFHRLFRAFVGETVNSFIWRIRLERAATKLANNPKISIIDLAFDSGFSSSQAFSRAFKEYFTISPTEFRDKGYAKFSKIDHAYRKQDNDIKVFSGYHITKDMNSPERRWKNMNVHVRNTKPMYLAYIRHIGPHAGDEKRYAQLFAKIKKWAEPRGLINSETKFLTVFHDDPKVTDEDKLRISVGITVPEGTKVKGDIGMLTIPEGKYAVARCEVFADEYVKAWNQLYCVWLPDSGFQLDDRPCFEVYLNDPKIHPEHKHIVELWETVKPA